MKIAFNSDQILSLTNYLLGLLAALLLGWGVSGNDVQFLTGLVLCAISFGVSIWMNGDNFHDAVFSLGRRVVMMLGAFGVARGWLTDTQAVQVVNVLLVVLPIVIGQWFYSDAPGPKLPGTTIVDPVTVDEIDHALPALPKTTITTTTTTVAPAPDKRDAPQLPK